MLNLRVLFLCSVALAAAAVLSGCGGSPARQGERKPTGTGDNSQEKPVAASPSPHAEHGDHGEHAGHSDAPHEAATKGLAELSEADRVLAQKQHICPVSDEMLGALGKPVKVSIQGRTVFLCCPDCEDDLKKDPDKYLAKLK
jgi:Cu(I)/Ag(I) efflux system membrane fusion protein